MERDSIRCYPALGFAFYDFTIYEFGIELGTARMETSHNIECPYCGQSFELVIDTSIAEQRFTTDCEVCCRPFELRVEAEPGRILSVEAW